MTERKQNTQNKDKKPERKVNIFNNLVYVERESPFSGIHTTQINPTMRVTRLQNTLRAIGVIEGKVLSFDDTTQKGEIEVEGCKFPFIKGKSNYDRIKFSDFVGKNARFTFWPTIEKDELPQLQDTCALPYLRIARVRKVDKPEHCYVEVIGKLKEILPNGFAVKIYSRFSKKPLRVLFSGEYPYPDEVEQFIWAVGKFNPKKGTVDFCEADAIAFVPEKEAVAILNKSKNKNPQKAAGGKKDKSDKEPIDLSLHWKETHLETERTMVNAKIKVVLRESPKIKEVGKLIWIPLQNQAKSVPGGMELPDTPIELMVTKKMWNTAKKKADSIAEETQKQPIYIFEAAIGIKDNKIAAVATGIQVAEGK